MGDKNPDDSTTRQTDSESDQVRAHQQTLDETMDAGGCAEAWQAAETIRQESETDSPTEITDDRRGVLKSALAGIAVPAIPGFQEADRGPGLPSIDEVVDGPEHVRSIMRESATDVLEMLSERGTIETPSLADFRVEEVVPLQEYVRGAATNAATVDVAFRDGEPVPELEAVQQTDEHRVILRVNPDTRRSYASVASRDPNGGVDIVAKHDRPCAAKTHKCYSWGCSWFERQIQVYCCGYEPDGTYYCEFHDRYCENGFCY